MAERGQQYRWFIRTYAKKFQDKHQGMSRAEARAKARELWKEANGKKEVLH